MTRFNSLLGATLAVGGLLAAGSTLLKADEPEGIIRISDCAPAQGCTNGCNTGCQPGCGNGCGNSCGRGCGHHCHCTGHVCRFLSWLDPCGGCALPPDAGWAPPGKVAMWRKPVVYNKFFPDQWTGAPGLPAGAGMRAMHVYMPTDTTQLGYYYQTVPQWQPNPAMTPTAPNPNDWHQPLCNGCPECNVIGVSGEMNCPQSTPAVPAAPEAPASDLKAAGTPNLMPTPR